MKAEVETERTQMAGRHQRRWMRTRWTGSLSVQARSHPRRAHPLQRDCVGAGVELLGKGTEQSRNQAGEDRVLRGGDPGGEASPHSHDVCLD